MGLRGGHVGMRGPCVGSRGYAWASRGHAWACVGTRGHAWAFEGHPDVTKPRTAITTYFCSVRQTVSVSLMNSFVDKVKGPSIPQNKMAFKNRPYLQKIMLPDI